MHCCYIFFLLPVQQSRLTVIAAAKVASGKFRAQIYLCSMRWTLAFMRIARGYKSSAAPTKSTPSSATFKGLTDSGEKSERANPSGCRFTDVTTAAGFNLTMDLCCKRGGASPCFLCCEPGGHKGGPTACPKVPPDRRDAVAKVVAFRALWADHTGRVQRQQQGQEGGSGQMTVWGGPSKSFMCPSREAGALP
jgi:hypothetical protein